MPFSHHSHSGQFCLHAQDTLEQMIVAAIAKGMIVFSLTEHMPRDCVEDLYPEEVGSLSFYYYYSRLLFPAYGKKESPKNHKNFFYFESNNSFSSALHFSISISPPSSKEGCMRLSPNNT